MARYSFMGLTLLSAASLLATRQCNAFGVVKAPLARSVSTKLAASDNDFDDFSAKVRIFLFKLLIFWNHYYYLCSNPQIIIMVCI